MPVFGINYGTVGFLAAVDPDDVRDGLTRFYAGDFEVMSLPALDAGEGRLALNDVSFHRRPHGRVAELTFSLGEQDVGHVRCDGLVAATPAGSTGYNLANNGPILAWGVEGYVVSFIAPHTLTARPLVAAPDDVLILRNAAGSRGCRPGHRRRARRRPGVRRRGRDPLPRRRRPARPAARRQLLSPDRREVRPPRRAASGEASIARQRTSRALGRIRRPRPLSL